LCTVQRCTGTFVHNAASAQLILRHYLSQHHEIGDNAIAKLVAWHAAQGEPRADEKKESLT